MFQTNKELKRMSRVRNETRRLMQRQSIGARKQVHGLNVTTGNPTGTNVPFQRVSISGIHSTGVPLEDLLRASHYLVQALNLRKNYMEVSNQVFNDTVNVYLTNSNPNRKILENDDDDMHDKLFNLDPEAAQEYLRLNEANSDEDLIGTHYDNRASLRFLPGHQSKSMVHMQEPAASIHVRGSISRHFDATQGGVLYKPHETGTRISFESQDDLDDIDPGTGAHIDPWYCPNPPDRRYKTKWVGGVVYVYRSELDVQEDKPIAFPHISFKKYIEDTNAVHTIMVDGPM